MRKVLRQKRVLKIPQKLGPRKKSKLLKLQGQLSGMERAEKLMMRILRAISRLDPNGNDEGYQAFYVMMSRQVDDLQAAIDDVENQIESL